MITQSSIMETHDNWGRGHIEPFWDNHHCQLEYIKEDFNSPEDIAKWDSAGYSSNYVGALCDMRKEQAWYTQDIVNELLKTFPITDIGTSYYRMETGSVLPEHRDTYKKYRKLFDCDLNNIIRIIVFVNNWESGHYFEIDQTPITNWKQGDYVWWRGDVNHMAANLGLTPRFTLQVTGHEL